MATSTFDSSSEDDDESKNDFSMLKIDWIDLSSLGYQNTIAITQLPGCKFKNTWRNIKKDLMTIVNAGISSVYVLLTNGELKKYRVSNLLDEYDNLGIRVRHLPFADGSAPDIDVVMNFICDLKSDIDNEHKILIHCLGGLGRSCLLVACFMMHMDESLTPDNVIETFRSIRGAGAIQTVKQYNFIQDFRNYRDNYDKATIEPRSVSR